MRLRQSQTRNNPVVKSKALRIDFVTLFPEMVLPALRHSILKRAEAEGHVQFNAANPRDFTTDPHRTVDDSPYGGGPGMVMKCEPVAQAIRSLAPSSETEIIVTDPTGPRFDQDAAQELSQVGHIILVCGHYEGIDDRIRQHLATRSYSLGDFILTGGEPAAIVMADAIVRLRPDVLGCAESLGIDAHSEGLLSAPQFTRPEIWEGLQVPEELCRGNHQAAERWKRRYALKLTREHRPDLFSRANLAKSDLDLL